MRNVLLAGLVIVVCALALSLHNQSLAIKTLQTKLNEGNAAEKANTAAFRQPTAEQAYRLQDDCVKRGELILKQNLIGSALAQEQVSEYNARTNRCYVLLSVHAADLNEWQKYENGNYLYDGQTKELLAWYRIEDQKKSYLGFACDDFDCVSEHVADCMAGKQCEPE